MSIIEFTIPGRPVPAVRMTQRSKWKNERAKKYLTYKGTVGWAAKAVRCPRFKGRVRVDIDLYIQGGRIGDVDNYAKSILDGLNGVAWFDDEQVAELHVYRHASKPQRAVVRVQEVEKAVG